MKILIVAPFDSKGRYSGGISSIVNTLCDSGKLQEKNVKVLKFNTCQISRSNATEARLNFQNLKNTFLIFIKLPRTIIAEEPDTIYFHTSVGMALLKDCMIIRNVKKQFPNVKIVVHIHFADYVKIMPSKEVFRHFILLVLEKYTDKIVFLSEKTKEEFIKNGIDRDKATVIYNFSTMSFDEDCLRKSGTNVLKYLFVGTLSHRKGIFDILSALNYVHGDYEFHICGDFLKAETKAAYLKAISGIEEKIFYHGFVKGEEKKHIFSDCDILLLPSYAEGLPVAILEGYSAGCAIIASNVGAIPEIVKMQNGIIVKPGDINGLAFAIQEYLDAGRHSLSKQQYTNYIESFRYSIDAFADSVFDICYRE